jgi:hypothetical protein
MLLEFVARRFSIRFIFYCLIRTNMKIQRVLLAIRLVVSRIDGGTVCAPIVRRRVAGVVQCMVKDVKVIVHVNAELRQPTVREVFGVQQRVAEFCQMATVRGIASRHEDVHRRWPTARPKLQVKKMTGGQVASRHCVESRTSQKVCFSMQVTHMNEIVDVRAWNLSFDIERIQAELFEGVHGEMT